MNTIGMQNTSYLKTGIAWCLAWGEQRQPQFDLNVLQEMRLALNNGKDIPEEVRSLVAEVQKLQGIDKNYLPKTLHELKDNYSDLWNQTTKVGLVYGGATKIKQYVFEASKLTDIRGASALLDRINLVDLPAFFGKKKSISISQWLSEHFPGLEKALIPELIIYSTGGHILAFCPAAFVNDLSNAIEKRYTEETLTANSCAVGDTFRLLELRFGLLQSQIENTPWLDWYHQNYKNPLVQAYFGSPKNDFEVIEAFKNRKTFNELTTKLAILFNQRRSGNDFPNRPTRRYPPMFETHPYLMRDEGDRRSVIARSYDNELPDKPNLNELPDKPNLSEASLRKRIAGQIAKREVNQKKLPDWFINLHLDWQPIGINIKSWVAEFEDYLNREENSQIAAQYYSLDGNPEEARTLRELGNVYKGFIAYIYADANNMGGYIKNIKTPEEYKQFSDDIFQAIEEAVYEALVCHLKPHKLENLTDPDNENRNGKWIHPFEILTIGGDDVMLIVPANKALEISQTIGKEFERRLLKTGRYLLSNHQSEKSVHRYCPEAATPSQCNLSMSTGVLITAKDTPVYYAEKLVTQLLISAKKRAKDLKKEGYHGGTVDFLVMKSVTMISSNIEEFRHQALTKSIAGQTFKQYASPYTLHELQGLLGSVRALKESKFPKSQIYQIRSLLERGKRTTILNYRYFRVRLKQEQQILLKINLEEAWCKAKTNNGNLAPWMSVLQEVTFYETIWRELVDLYDFIETSQTETSELSSMEAEV